MTSWSNNNDYGASFTFWLLLLLLHSYDRACFALKPNKLIIFLSSTITFSFIKIYQNVNKYFYNNNHLQTHISQNKSKAKNNIGEFITF